MITIENIINYIKKNIDSFDFCAGNVITNQKIVINNRYGGDCIEIARYDINFDAVYRFTNYSVKIIIKDIDEEQYNELNNLFKFIEKKIKKEIESEILSI
jgi:hypothetical protein